MKPIILNLNDISDSREVYESKPNPFFAIFIYTITSIIIIALIWMYFGKIDIVVKSEGMLRPNDQIATVINTYGGRLEKVFIRDGDLVREGDILYIIEHGDLLKELEHYNELLEETGTTIVMLNKYKKSIENGVNYFSNTPEEEEYFVKTETYLLNYKRAEQDFNYNSKELETNLNSINKQLENLEQELKYTKTLKSAIISNKNLFSTTENELKFYNKYLKYKSDYQTLNQKYVNARTEINNSTVEEGLVNSLDYYNNALEGLKILKASIEKDKSLFEHESSYSLQYEEYINRIADLEAAYEKAKENYEINKALEGLAVSEWEVQQSKLAMEEAERAIETYKVNFMNNITTNITEIEKNIEEIKLNKEHIISKDVLLKKNEEERIAALDNFKLQYIVELDNTISSLEENITKLESNKQSLELQREKIILDENGTESGLLQFENNELSATINSINSLEIKKSELEANIAKIKTQVENAVVKASKTGNINCYIDLVEGDILQSGIEVLSIIPENDNDFKVNIFVSNEDIGKLQEGMNVKFNVYALPSAEYGYLTGSIINISKDLKVNNSGAAYYLVEARLDNSKLYNSKGQAGNLKSGMACQAQIITGNKRILIYLLEKLDLWINK